MFALVRQDGKVGWVDLPSPLLGPGDVLIAPRLVGICRTDLAVAFGHLAVDEPRVIGHELVAEVIEVGADVRNCAVGDSVAVNPVISCGECALCTDGWEQACAARRFMGVECDGALAETVVVPARNVWAMPIGMEDTRAAMLEPVAACMSVLKAPIDPDDLGVMSGTGRLAVLTRQILAMHGIDRVDRLSDAEQQQEPYDYAIDTEGTTQSIEQLLSLLRPGGLLVLKSRATPSISLSLRNCLPKEPLIQAVNYGSFLDARRLLVERELDITSLIGPCWAAENFAEALSAAANDEQTKHFLALPTRSFSSKPMWETCDFLTASQ